MRRLVRALPLLLLIVLALPACAAFEVRDAAHDGDEHAEEAAAPIEGATTVAVTAGSLAFDSERIEVRAGEPINVVLESTDMLHDLVVDEVDFHVAADGGETGAGGVVFDQPGTYTAYCSVAGHREAGMELEFVVL